ncbi:MAG: hypothetical protein RIC15_00975 [Vicingaceae bacterium]
MKEYHFPQFRKYTNNQSFFKVLSEDEFEEVKKMPTGYALHRFRVKILPDRNYVSDMLDCANGHWVKIPETEYTKLYALTLASNE